MDKEKTENLKSALRAACSAGETFIEMVQYADKIYGDYIEQNKEELKKDPEILEIIKRQEALAEKL